MHRSELTVDLGAVRRNARTLLRALDGAQLWAVVKADGYGYGAAEMGAVFIRNGADYLAVADLTEGIRMRQRGITAPILVYPNSLPVAAADALAHGLVLARHAVCIVFGDLGSAAAANVLECPASSRGSR